jgi:HPr kinase/phosphorylase
MEKSYLHASAVVIGEAGVLIFGPSGAGKSGLALALIAAAEAAGCFARLVGDDRIGIVCKGARLIASGHPMIPGKIERRGQGIFEMPYLPAAIVRLVIGLGGAKDPLPLRYPGESDGHVVLAGAKVSFAQLRQDAAVGDLAAAVLADPRLHERSPRRVDDRPFPSTVRIPRGGIRGSSPAPADRKSLANEVK